MARHWMVSVLAAVAVSAAPVLAEEIEAAPTAEAASPAGEPAAAPATKAVVMAQAPAQPEEKAPEPPAAPKFTYGGSADFYFSTNFNDPRPPFNATRAFDIKDEHGPHLGLIDIWAQYARDPIGFRLDLNWGPTAGLVNAFEPTDDDVWEHVQQAYISANLNRSGTTYVDFGKWVTTAGAEVIEPKDNWLYSRGLLFNLAIPFYHMGLRGYHYFNSTDYVGGAVHRGWNAVSSPGHDVGFALFGAKALDPKWTVIGNYYGGDEFGPKGKSYRSLLDLIALYNASPKWSYTFNFDYVHQSGSNLYGLSTQAKYAFHPKQYLAARGEFLIDDGFLGSDLFSLTLGYAYTINKNFQTRLEYRHDFGSEDVFFDSPRGTFAGDQGTFLISAIVSY